MNNKEIKTEEKKTVRKIDSRLLKKILMTLSIFMFTVIIGGALYFYYYMAKIPRTEVDGLDTPPITEETAKKYNLSPSTNSLGITDNYQKTILKDKKNSSVENILFIIIDGKEGNKTADSLLILSVDNSAATMKVSTLNVNSDVFIPDRGPGALKTSFSVGGAEAAIFTVNSNFGLNITHFISIDTSSLDEIIDVLGGIEVNLLKNEAEVLGKKEGRTVLSGSEVKRYTSITGSPIDSARRNQFVMNGVLKAVTESNAADVPSKVDQLLPILNTSYSTGDIIKKALELTRNKYDYIQVEFPSEREITSVAEDGLITYNKYLVRENLINFIFGKDNEKEYRNKMPRYLKPQMSPFNISKSSQN